MAYLKYRYLTVILLLAMTASVIYGLQYDTSTEENSGLADLQRIPLQIGELWHGQDLPLEEMVYEILETKAIIHRSYTATEGDSVFLSIVHYPDTKVDFHTPEACLGGQGFKTEKRTKTITLSSGDQYLSLDVAEIITTNQIGKTLTYYFYKSGQYAGSNYIKMRLSIAYNKLLNDDTRGSLIRISTTLIQGDEVRASTMLNKFLKDFSPYVQISL